MAPTPPCCHARPREARRWGLRSCAARAGLECASCSARTAGCPPRGRAGRPRAVAPPRAVASHAWWCSMVVSMVDGVGSNLQARRRRSLTASSVPGQSGASGSPCQAPIPPRAVSSSSSPPWWQRLLGQRGGRMSTPKRRCVLRPAFQRTKRKAVCVPRRRGCERRRPQAAGCLLGWYACREERGRGC